MSGPLWFGDPETGYTIAYVFKLRDASARGRLRHYALLALAGKERPRAFQASTLVWTLFEEIAMHIIRTANEVGKRAEIDDAAADRENAHPSASLLTGHKVNSSEFSWLGATKLKATGIAELVSNENFFCELHMMFVGMLQNLGKALDSLPVRLVPAKDGRDHRQQDARGQGTGHSTDRSLIASTGSLQHLIPTSFAPAQLPSGEAFTHGNDRFVISQCSPRVTAQRRRVAV